MDPSHVMQTGQGLTIQGRTVKLTTLIIPSPSTGSLEFSRLFISSVPGIKFSVRAGQGSEHSSSNLILAKTFSPPTHNGFPGVTVTKFHLTHWSITPCAAARPLATELGPSLRAQWGRRGAGEEMRSSVSAGGQALKAL